VECASPKGKRLSVNAPRPLRSARLSRETAAYEPRQASMGKVGPAGPEPRRGFKGELNFKFEMNLEFGKIRGILQGDLERIWT
jgi:hypothetical protein